MSPPTPPTHVRPLRDQEPDGHRASENAQRAPRARRDARGTEPPEPFLTLTPTQPLRVLVVDDDAESREILQMAISDMGHECAVAADGLEAWVEHQANPADVILSDWVMPRMNGLELCRLVRTQGGEAYTYFVFMTALGTKTSFLEGMRTGADDYLTKPADVEELEARLQSAHRVMSLQRELGRRNATLRREGDLASEAARLDPLTQVGNRLRLREDLEMLRSRAARYGHRYCAALCDIDDFKGYDDSYGHLAGDDVLRSVAATMHRALRGSDMLYRYGGDEFLIILAEKNLGEGAQAMERVRAAVERAALPYARSPRAVVTISIGVAELHAGLSHEDWLGRADAALYRAKARGRNCVEVADMPEDEAEAEAADADGNGKGNGGAGYH
jgi:two-component system cell cycle response regulator